MTIREWLSYGITLVLILGAAYWFEGDWGEVCGIAMAGVVLGGGIVGIVTLVDWLRGRWRLRRLERQLLRQHGGDEAALMRGLAQAWVDADWRKLMPVDAKDKLQERR